ncbi:Spherulation-specific family 4 protein [Rutstroemia sp. NJR-2017a WRK4]|nr:Spherulation-specific family 4 protein [Rutstroemia sp. NJR-2017a WRK4]
MVLPAFVFLPLYLYPYNTTSWSTLTNSVAKNPNLSFNVVVAPNLAAAVPDANYISALSDLNTYSNVRTLGYLYTSYGARNVTEIEAEISVYAGWAQSTPKIAVDGVFFDETPSNPAYLSYLTAISNYARSTLPNGSRYVFLNPGVPVDASVYALADAVNIFEESWANFNQTALRSVDANLLAKSSYAIHDFTVGIPRGPHCGKISAKK